MARKRDDGVAATLEAAFAGHIRNWKRRRADWVDGVEENLRGLLRIAADHDEAVSEVRADEHLTPLGKAKAAEKVARETLGKLDRFEQERIKNVRKQVEAAEAEIRGIASPQKPSDPAERLAHELRAREVRDQLRGLDAEKRLTVYLTTSNADVVAAIEDAPPIVSDGRLVPFIDPGKVASARVERAKRAAPEAAGELADLQSLERLYSMAADGIKQQVKKDAPPTEGEIKIVESAGG